jgi:hypothetical protein
MPEHTGSTVALRFGHSRASDGTDIAAIVKAAMPEADVRAELDASGAVAHYLVVLIFADSDRAADAAFRLTEFFCENGWDYEVTVDA